MRLPRDFSGSDLTKALRTLGYEVTRQTGGQIRLTTRKGGEHHITIPNHRTLRAGTLAAILSDVADHSRMDREELARLLLG